jgi:hypothetical protein
VRRGLVIALLALGLIGAVAASSASAVSNPSASKVPDGESDVQGSSVVLLRPNKPTNRLVLYMHGTFEEAKGIQEGEMVPMTRELLRQGFAVGASTGGDDNNWGDPPSVADSVAFARATGYRHIYILAASMGGVGGVELIDKLHPVAWAGIYPVCNVRNLWARGNSSREIEEAWGPGEPPSKISPVKAKDVNGLPVLMWASPEDHEVPIGPNARTCASWMKKGGAKVKLIETTGEHGDPSNFQPRRLANFFLAAKTNR